MEVAPVHEGDVRGRAPQLEGGLETAKPAPDDHHTVHAFPTHRTARLALPRVSPVPDASFACPGLELTTIRATFMTCMDWKRAIAYQGDGRGVATPERAEEIATPWPHAPYCVDDPRAYTRRQ